MQLETRLDLQSLRLGDTETKSLLWRESHRQQINSLRFCLISLQAYIPHQII